MICFRDMTFCNSDCTRAACRRHFGADDQAAAEKWWGKPGAPVAFSDFSEDCPDYTRPKDASASG
ncbi:MAG: hypothetical protein IT555_21915 [Acetobacteraceae bacterium]|nr:hypothetical protein [Acetobacteraceae bacterium]